MQTIGMLIGGVVWGMLGDKKGITLVAEVMSKSTRGPGTSLVSGIGILGAVLAFTVTEQFDWRVAYFTGGGNFLILFSPVKGSTSVMLHYIGASPGSFIFALLSRKWQSRKKAFFVAILL